MHLGLACTCVVNALCMNIYAQGWDVKRVYYGRHNKPDMDKEGVELVKDLDEFLKQCDVVSINVPLSDKTK